MQRLTNSMNAFLVLYNSLRTSGCPASRKDLGFHQVKYESFAKQSFELAFSYVTVARQFIGVWQYQVIRLLMCIIYIVKPSGNTLSSRALAVNCSNIVAAVGVSSTSSLSMPCSLLNPFEACAAVSWSLSMR